MEQNWADRAACRGLDPAIFYPLTDDEAGGAAADDADASGAFAPEDVHVRPPDHPPTEDAPASEKAGLIFERS